jgi:7,8-dihydro-6-hydroxymethylpterin dimethyltransferase
MTDEESIFRTWSVCPECLKTIPAERVRADGNIFLRKTCPEHGSFQTITWRGYLDYDQWISSSDTPSTSLPLCPGQCGLCSDHLQDTCCVLLNVTEKCNLQCRFCLAGNSTEKEPSLSDIKRSLAGMIVPGKSLVQLSGGEPTMRNDLPEIVRSARELGAKYVQLNTNGVRLGEDKRFAARLAEEGLSFVFMQFDGTDDAIMEALRGKPLLKIKKEAISNCAGLNLGVTLVPTIVGDVNLHDIGNILRFAVSESPRVRGVHFQPVSFFGKIPHAPSDHDRVTLDELIHEIVNQGGGIINSSDLLPSCCDHPLCGFHGDFVVHNNTLVPLLKKQEKENTCCYDPQAAEKNREFIARRWKRQPGEDNKVEPDTDISDMENFLRHVKTHGFTVTAMAFQDAWNIDISRLRKCSFHVYDDGQFVPFCSYYLTAMNDGK